MPLPVNLHLAQRSSTLLQLAADQEPQHYCLKLPVFWLVSSQCGEAEGVVAEVEHVMGALTRTKSGRGRGFVVL